MSKPFEEYIDFIENKLGIRLLAYQKEALRHMYENKPYYYRPARGSGFTVLNKAMILLEEMKEENDNE